MAGEHPGQHLAVAGLGGGACRGGEPVPCVLLVAPVVLDDRDQPGQAGGRPYDGGAVACGVGAFQYVPQQLEVLVHLGEDGLRVAAVVAAGVPLEHRLQVRDVGGVRALQCRVDALVRVGELGQGPHTGHRQGSGDE
ncbi:hypothetical protein [Streptomyces sp. Agncl-13]|uniref:hypothetical protein n=1 Tax=Streptomyces sp. Agncl-13 TaxID=3400628 RepID=UPI003A88E618